MLLSVGGFVLLVLMAQKTSAGGLPLLMVAAAVEVSGIAFVFPAVQALISRRTDPAKQGGILGAGESVSSVGLQEAFLGRQAGRLVNATERRVPGSDSRP